MPYATPEELNEYLGHSPDQAGRMLARASRLVDSALISARYDPNAPAVVDALRDAVLEQCAEWDGAGADGTESGDPGAWASVAAGSISLSRGSAAGGGAATSDSTTVRLSHQAWLALQQAGLTGHGPAVGWV